MDELGKKKESCCWRDSKREIMPLTLEIDRGSRKTFEGKRSFMSVILSGCGIKEEAKKLYNYGVDEILCIEDEKLIEGHMQLHHDAVIEVLKEKDPKVILIGGTASGRVLAGKTAYAFDTELVCDASKLTYDEKQEQLIITRPAFDGKNYVRLFDRSILDIGDHDSYRSDGKSRIQGRQTR